MGQVQENIEYIQKQKWLSFSQSECNNVIKIWYHQIEIRQIQIQTEKKQDADHTANAVIKSGSSQLRPLQWATIASMTSKFIDESSQSYSESSEWLIDSGCSNHMTPFEDDLISDVTKSKSLVEVANGNIVKAPKKGTVLIWIVDVKTNKTFDILLEDVLYYPA